jgi:hypothetical protein
VEIPKFGDRGHETIAAREIRKGTKERGVEEVNIAEIFALVRSLFGFGEAIAFLSGEGRRHWTKRCYNWKKMKEEN